jgi:hypothetical protein
MSETVHSPLKFLAEDVSIASFGMAASRLAARILPVRNTSGKGIRNIADHQALPGCNGGHRNRKMNRLNAIIICGFWGECSKTEAGGWRIITNLS